MNPESLELVRNTLLLVAATGVLYGIARCVNRIGDAWTARMLAPLAPAIDGTIDPTSRCLNGTYQGRHVLVSMTPGQAVGSEDSATTINAFYVEVTDLPGRQDWRIKFHVSGMLGQGPKQLHIEVSNTALATRLEAAGVLEAVAAVSAATTDYVTVQYDSRRGHLTYTDDVAPRRVPTAAGFAAQLDLVAQLADINARVNQA